MAEPTYVPDPTSPSGRREVLRPVPYARPPAPPAGLAVRGLGVALLVLFGALALCSVADLVLLYRLNSLLDRTPLDLSTVDTTDVTTMQHRTDVVYAVTVTVLLALLVVWIVWSYRARSNAETWGGYARLRPGWAIGGWFVPIGNLFLPFMVVLDIVDGTEMRTAEGTRFRVSRVLLGAWWVLLLARFVANSVLSADVTAASSLREIAHAVHIGFWVEALDLAGVAAAALVVRSITQGQSERMRAGIA